MGINKRKLVFPLILTLVFVIAGCSNESNKTEIVESAETTVDYDTEDVYADWSESDATFIEFSDQSAFVEDDNSGVVVSDNTVNIHTSGTYVLEGDASDSQLIVDAEDQGTVRIILNGVSLTSTTTAPIFVKQADKTVFSVEDGTENTLTDASEYVYEDEDSDEPKAAIYSKDDLTINGTGQLTVNGNFNDGITGNDDLKVIGAAIHITAVDDGIVGRDLFAMKDASITVDAGGDGVKSSNDEGADKANIVLESGKLTVDAEGDGIASENTVTVLDGEYNIVAGGGSPETIEATEEFGGGMGGQGGMQGQMPSGEGVTGETLTPPEGAQEGEVPQFEEGQAPSDNGQVAPPEQATNTESQQSGDSQTQTQDSAQQTPEQAQNTEEQQQGTNAESTESTESEEDIPSTKGIKAVNSVMIAGGTISIDSNDDALHSDKELTIINGDISINTGDDAVHADESLAINGGNVQVDKSYEGIESQDIIISDGTIHLTTADDGFNVNGGTDEMGMFGKNQGQTTEQTTDTEQTDETEEEGQLLIEGGYIYVNADGDGLDSNTSATMTGGTVLVYGPTNSGNGALDYNSAFTVEGGTLIATGSSGMAQGVSEDSPQNSILMTFPEMLEANTTVYVTDSNGDVVTAVTPEKQFQTVVISSPDLKQDEAYTIYTGGELTGDVTDGYAEEATAEGGTKIVEFTLNSAMMYLNESGETEQTGEMFGPGGGQGQGQGKEWGQNQNGTQGTQQQQEQSESTQ
ncbi:carbohydrate-binding domain-containing protein [Gracilibacillus caseinilyticus]|uniref:Carbohydrate-binding domain-containing protein n=1 Tax=Gracilibacillus caseinilyticus TaxID=2932256 RepID=A0ABY4EXR0_9BACI|nr:carbohydrate-binding domain-containing protein [Gracilibacillus caseinilyticus]UOQ49069.1 carbohydrate-binding domain-containing protein [Gracilibacillus caseinilyticus]